jgi:1-acyl-sn-glycerol-3-phosphate acyltransferase
MAAELDGVFVRGLEEAIECNRAEPLVLAATHVSFWDPLLLVAIEERFEQALTGPSRASVGYALMHRANLEKLPFFGLVGAIPLGRGTHARADLEDARALVTGPSERLWIFPQGRQRPPHLRPLDLKPGVLTLAEGKAVLPVAITYAFRDAEVPACVVAIGPPLRELRELAPLEVALERELTRCDRFADAPKEPDPSFVPLIPSRRRPPGEDFASSVLSFVSRRFVSPGPKGPT